MARGTTKKRRKFKRKLPKVGTKLYAKHKGKEYVAEIVALPPYRAHYIEMQE